MAQQLAVQAQPFTLYGSGASLGDTSITLTNFNGIDGTPLTLADFGTIGYLTMEPGSSTQEEQVSFSGITNNANGTVTLTGIHTVLFISPFTSTSGLAKSHAGATRVVVSNTSAFYSNFANKIDDETITGNWTFNNKVAVGAVTSSDVGDAATVAYVNSVAIAGAPDASTTVKGIVQEATQAQADARTATGSTGARTYVNPSTVHAVLMHDYAVSAAGTDAYAITLTPAPTAYTTGDIYVFKADVANTGAATLNVNGLGAKTITDKNGSTLLDSDIQTNSITTVIYDGTNMQVLSTTGSKNVQQGGQEVYGATATGTDSYAVTLSPVPTALVDGMTLRIKLDVGNTGPATLNVNGLGAVAIVLGLSTPLLTGDIVANEIINVTYNSTGPAWQLLNGVRGTDVQEFTSNGTWTKPVGAKSVTVLLVGSGGGGGSGEVVNGSDGGSGGGGGGGAVVFASFNAANIGSTETITVGVGGTGGAGTVRGTPGNAGGNGGTSSFGTWVSAGGGGGGLGGTAGTGGVGGGSGSSLATASGQTAGAPTAGGAAGLSTQGVNGGAATAVGFCAEYGGGSGAGGIANNTGSAGGSSIFGGAGGGSGAGGSATNAGGAGGTVQSYVAGGGGAGATDASAPGTNGSDNSTLKKGYGGSGGGGGGATNGTGIAGTCSAGGNGGSPGGGGGGGAGARNDSSAVTSGSGGNGGNGFVRVVTYS